MTKVLLSHPPRPASHNSNRAMVWVRKNLFSGLAQRVPTAQKPVPVGSSSTNDLVSLCMGFTHTTNAGELTSHY